MQIIIIILNLISLFAIEGCLPQPHKILLWGFGLASLYDIGYLV